MVSTMRFVGATVDTLLAHTSVHTGGSEIGKAATEFLAALTPIGDPFEVPWKLGESLEVLDPWVPETLVSRLLHPGTTPPVNHLEASALSLAREAGMCLEPFTPADMHRLQHGVRRAIQSQTWGRQSPHPWDTIAEAGIDSSWFVALLVPAMSTAASPR